MTNLFYKTATNAKCSCRGCNNKATSYLLARQKVYLCDTCFERLAAEAIAHRTPKSPTNTIKRKLDKKREEMYD